MDLISRQATIDQIDERQRELIYCFGFENDMIKIMNIAKSIVIAMPSARPEPQWIPCSERLPEKDGRYLVWAVVSFVPDHVDEPCTYQETTIANFFTYRGGASWDGHSVEKVLAWRELPEPWRGANS